MKHVLALFVFMMILATLSVGCGQQESPENAARIWINALLQKNGSELSKRTCSRLQGPVQGSLKIGRDYEAGPIAQLVIGLGMNVVDEKCPGNSIQEKSIRPDASQLQFTVISGGEDKAEIKVNGQLTNVCVSSNVSVGPSSSQAGTWQMIREDGIWKWCGSK